jgi:hypothetical protein
MSQENQYSVENPSPKLINTLKDMLETEDGTISYHFVRHENGERKVSSTYNELNRQCFFNDKERRKKTPLELLELFQDLANDRGASYFVVE